MLVERLGPGVGHLACGALPLRAEVLQLLTGVFSQPLVGALGLLCQRRHGLFHHRAHGGGGLLGTGAQAVLQRCAHGLRQLGVGGRGLFVKPLLLRQQLVVELAVAALQPLHHGLQAVGNQRQGLGLRLQGLQCVLSPLGGREGTEQRGDACIQLADRLQPFTAAQGGQQAQCGRRSHPRDRRTKRQAQSLDGRSQCVADGFQVARGLQGEHGTVERHHHAHKGAQHAQHHQQSHQVGRERWARQGHSLAFDALPNRVAQCRVQAFQPGLQRRRLLMGL